MDAINAYPHHGFEKNSLANLFYDGLTLSMKQLVESMYNKPKNEAPEFSVP